MPRLCQTSGVVRTFLRWLVVSLVCAVGVPVVSGLTVLMALIFLPLPATLPTPKAGLVSRPSQILAADGSVIGTFSQFDQSLPVTEGQIPQVLKNALVASEDENFYKEGGVSPRGTLRAFIRDLQGKGYVQGGSTITQQYVSLAYTGKKRTLARKLREAILASQLARQVPKDQILYKYLDTVYLGDGCYGVGAAAQSYFRVPVEQLNIGQAALLVGLIPAPSRYEPRGNPQLAELRRQTVLLKMYQQHYISDSEYQYWKVSQVYESTAPPLPPGAPVTLVYPNEQAPTKYPYFVDYVRRYLEDQPNIGPDLLYQGGLQIQTTLDPILQAEAQASVDKTLLGTTEPLEMALVSIEPQTGHVRALIGGRDFSADQTNLALGGCENEAPYQPVITATCVTQSLPESGGTGRQPGSSFKPFVLATAFAHGVLPSESFYGPSAIKLPRGCNSADPGCTVIHNAEPGGGVFSLARATWYSVNTVFAQLILDPRVTVQATADTAKKLGITSAWYSPSHHGASYALGALDVAPLDMASAYGVFDNHGIRVPPTPVVRVEDANGKLLIDTNVPPLGAMPDCTGVAGVTCRALDPVIADNVTNVLTGVISQPGATGYASANIGRPAAGKTGTTSSFVDAWFVGYTPTLSTSVWMGRKNTEDPAKGASMTTITSAGRHQTASPVFGGTFPAETWAEYMKQALADVPATNFNQPAPLQPVADALDKQLRGGLDPGTHQTPPTVSPGGPYVTGPAPPVATVPTATTEPAAPTTTVGTPFTGAPEATTTTTLAPPSLFGPGPP